MGRKLKIGDRATNFSLEDQEGRLHAFRFQGEESASFFPPIGMDVCMLGTDEIFRKK